MRKRHFFSMTLIAFTCLSSLSAAPSSTSKSFSSKTLLPSVRMSVDEQTRISPLVRVIVKKNKSEAPIADQDPFAFHLLSSASEVIFSLDNPSSFQDVESFLQNCKKAINGSSSLQVGSWTTEKKLKAFSIPCTIREPREVEVIFSGNLSKEALERIATDVFKGISFDTQEEEQKIYTFYDSHNQMSVFSLDFTNKKFSLLDSEDLSKYWLNGVVQKFLSKKMETEMNKLKAVLLTKQPESPIPDFYVGLTISCTENNSLEAIGNILLSLEEFKKQGISPSELTAITDSYQETLKSREAMHSFYENGFGLTYSDFIKDSSSILSSFNVKDLNEYMQELIKEENFQITLTSPAEQPVSKEEVLETLEQMKNIISLNYLSPFSKTGKSSNKGKSGIPIPVEGNPTDLFLKLPLKENEKKTIISIVETIADSNVFQLALKEQEVSQKGDKVNHVHPLRFLGVVFSDPKLKNNMAEIKKNYFKWNGFVGGFSKRIEEEYQRDNLMRYIPGFASYLNIDQEQIKKYINNQDWDGLVRFLIN